VLSGLIAGDPTIAEWLRKVARPAGLEPATSWFVANSFGHRSSNSAARHFEATTE